MDTEVSKIEESALFLVWTGRAGDENAQFYVCCEQSVLTESKDVWDAIIDLMGSYYLFDIAYPKTTSAVMLFFSIVFLNFRTSKCFLEQLLNLSVI